MIPKKSLTIRGMSVNDFDYMKLSLASPEQIIGWSYGEVKKAETINYRTHKPEKDGLFCAKIFGPINDYECLCGKYKRKKYKGMICEKCGVEVTERKVRRERMGHIELVSPVTHIWYLRGPGSKIALTLGIDQKDLERVVYFERYIVVDPGEASSEVDERDVLTEKEYQKLLEKYSEDEFDIRMGAEAIRDLLKKTDPKKEAEKLRKALKKEKSAQNKLKLSKRLRTVEAFIESGNRPEWMVLEVLPVLPPDLRPLVRLDSGTFASSDLNELYRRIINRNNRLRKLIDQNAPEIIIKNEKRMLQEAVDALFENGARGKYYLASNNRPLKSLSDSLKGKTGRFRQNLLGKRVDYSGRSVIVVNPNLKLHQCGLPKLVALELFKPFVIRLLEDRYAVSIAGAKDMIDERAPEVWECLEDAVKYHPVLLNRAPTLHRNSIQAFEPILVEGKAIQIHPMVCPAFNADFDGDQMAVHVPLSIEAQVESRELMLAPLNILSPANGKPLAIPTQDMVLGIYYLTIKKNKAKGEGRIFATPDDVRIAYELGYVDLHARILLKWNGKVKNIEKYIEDNQDIANCPVKEISGIIETTPGRVLLNNELPPEIPFINGMLNKKGVQNLVYFAYQTVGLEKTVEILNSLKEIGFEYATLAGFSIAASDMITPPSKEKLIKEAEKEVDKIIKKYEEGVVSPDEKHNMITDIWERVTNNITKEMRKNIEKKMEETGELNSLLIMAQSGARGKMDQVRQLAGMRGLMAKPSGEVIENPIKSNFREGLTSLEYFISTHGARKGSADTALKTAEAGYLTRRLVDVAQDVVVTEEDCGTTQGMEVSAIIENGEIVESFYDRILGRTSLERVVKPETGEVIVDVNEEIDEEKAKKIIATGKNSLKIRTLLTCKAKHGVCQKCYGRDMARGRTVSLGEAVGIIAAQSIGEPGTQLTMRTFHIGGIASGLVNVSSLKARNEGTVKLTNVKFVQNEEGEHIVINRTGIITIVDHKGREKETYPVVYGAKLMVNDGDKVKKGDVLTTWDPYSNVVLTEFAGYIEFKDIIEDITLISVRDDRTGHVKKQIIKSKDEKKQPMILIKDEDGNIIREYHIPADAFLEVKNGDKVKAGQVIARMPRETAKTKDITGGLPRAQDLFEARKPQNPAILSEIDGYVKFGPVSRGLRKIIIENEETGDKKEYNVPTSSYILVQEGDYIKTGQPLIEAPSDPHKILEASGEEALAKYLIKEIQQVYRSQGVEINDKHIEVIIRQMLKWVKIEEIGDSKFYYGQLVDKFTFQEELQRILAEGGEPPKANPALLGISKAALNTDSFISAASFQQTTRVLAEAAFFAKIDKLLGIKENVTMGRLIPAGTGFKEYQKYEVVEKIVKEEEGA